MQLLVQFVQVQCIPMHAGADLRTPVLPGLWCDQQALGYRARGRSCPATRDRRQVTRRPLNYMDTHRNATTGHQPGWPTGDHFAAPAAPAGSHAEVGRLVAHLEQRLEELDRLHREIAEDAHALAHAAAATPEGRDGTRSGSVYSIRAAAAELGVSVSMLHKLLKQRRLGHLKVGARTLITAEHLEQFREASEVPTPETSPEPSQERAVLGTGESSSLDQRRSTSTTAGSAVVSVAAS